MVMKIVGKFAKDTVKGVFSHLIDPIFVKTKEFNYFIDLFMARNNMGTAESVYIKFIQVLIDNAKSADELKYVKIFAYKIRKDLESQYKMATGKPENDALSTYFDYSLPIAIERKGFQLGLSKYEITIHSKQTKEAEKRFNDNFQQFMSDALDNKLVSADFIKQVQLLLKTFKSQGGNMSIQEKSQDNLSFDNMIKEHTNIFGGDAPNDVVIESVYSLGLIATSAKAQFKRDVLSDWSSAKEVWIKAVKNASTPEDIKKLRSDYQGGLKTMTKREKNKPNKSLTAHLKWLRKEGKEILDEKADEIFKRGTKLKENASDEASAKMYRDTSLESKSDTIVSKFQYFIHCANTIAYMDMIDDMFSDFKQKDFYTMCKKGGKDKQDAMWVMVNVPRMIRQRRIELFAKH